MIHTQSKDLSHKFYRFPRQGFLNVLRIPYGSPLSKIVRVSLYCSIAILLFCNDSYAEVQSGNVLNSVLQQYMTKAQSWATVIQTAATRLFWTLTAISMVWTFSQLMFHRSSLAELFGEMIRFMVFTGFYFWLLTNGPKMADAVIDSMLALGEQASQQPSLNPSKIVDVGFKIVDMACSKISAWSLLSDVTSLGCLLVSLAVLVILALVGINMLLQLCSAWVLAYAGIFFLGFGGSRWTSDMAINYFKTVLGLGASLMTMILLVGIGTDIINEYHQKMTAGMNLQELAVLLVVSISLLLLTDKLPAMVSGIITGASIGSSGGASFGAGSAMTAGMAAGGAAMTAGSVASGGVAMAGRTALAGAANISGMFSAGKAAIQKAGEADSGMGRASGMSGAMGNKSASAAEVGKVLGKAAAGMAGQAVNNMKQGFADRAANTVGGRMASSIKGEGDKGGNDA